MIIYIINLYCIIYCLTIFNDFHLRSLVLRGCVVRLLCFLWGWVWEQLLGEGLLGCLESICGVLGWRMFVRGI